MQIQLFEISLPLDVVNASMLTGCLWYCLQVALACIYSISCSEAESRRRKQEFSGGNFGAVMPIAFYCSRKRIAAILNFFFLSFGSCGKLAIKDQVAQDLAPGCAFHWPASGLIFCWSPRHGFFRNRAAEQEIRKELKLLLVLDNPFIIKLLRSKVNTLNMFKIKHQHCRRRARARGVEF